MKTNPPESISVEMQTTITTTATVVITGRFDALVCPDIRAEFDARLANGCDHLVADLSDAHFVDSVGLAALVKAMRDAKAAGSSFTILRPRSDDAMRVFRLSKFDEVFTIRAKDE